MNPIQGDILFQLFQQVNERIWYYDTETDKICYVAADGSTEESIPFAEHMSMKHPDDRAQVFESMEYMVKNRRGLDKPMLIRYQDESQPDGYRYTMNAIIPIFEGDIIRVVGSEQDITPMVRKQQLAEQQTELIEQLLKSRNEDTWTVNRDTRVITVKKSNGDIRELTFDAFDEAYNIEESSGVLNAMDVFRKGEPKISKFYLCEKPENENEQKRFLKCNSMPSRYDYQGNVVEYVGVSTDVSKERENTEMLTKALEKAEEKSRQKSVFVARASHDLRNPLNVLLSLSEMMCMDMPNEERQELSDMMKQSGEALLTLINDILDLSRIESGTIQFSKEPFNIVDLISGIISSFDISTNKSHNILLNTEIENTNVVNDSKRLSQVVNNYLSNAIKYSPAGSNIEVTVKNNDPDGLYIAVKDSGCGIGDGDKHKVFSEFARFNTEVSGTGLGLSICKRIAEGLGGHVGFESELGNGSTFWIKIS